MGGWCPYRPDSEELYIFEAFRPLVSGVVVVVLLHVGREVQS